MESLLQSESDSPSAGLEKEGVADAPHGVKFAHPSETEFARILDFYGVKWSYEPHSFPLRWEGDRTVEMFTPDFYLPDLDMYIELTTLRQKLVTEKNRKLRHLRELYPDVSVKLLYKRDYHRLLAKYGYGPLAQEDIRGIDHVLVNAQQIQRRVRQLGREISLDYAGRQPVLVGVLKGVLCFVSDLMRHIPLPLSVEFMSISHFDGHEQGVTITKDLDRDITGQHVLMVEDIVDTGMTLNYLLNYLRTRHPASLKVCALLDKRVRRLVEVPLDYAGFEVPDEFVVGYGLDYLEKYRNLPFIGVLKPQDDGRSQTLRWEEQSSAPSNPGHSLLTPLATAFQLNPPRLPSGNGRLLSTGTGFLTWLPRPSAPWLLPPITRDVNSYYTRPRLFRQKVPGRGAAAASPLPVML